jgi:hypothetical protein
MLLVWKMPVARPTRDIDLLGRVSNDLASFRIIASICQIPTKSDGMVFDSETVTTERRFMGNAWQYTSPDTDRHRFQATSSHRNPQPSFTRQFLDIPPLSFTPTTIAKL